MMTRSNGLSRLAYAALSAGLVWLGRRVVRASDAFTASGYRRPAQVALALAKGLLGASGRAHAVAFPKARM